MDFKRIAPRPSLTACLSIGFLVLSSFRLSAQSTVDTARKVTRAWAFARLGPAEATKDNLRGEVSGSLAAGLAASYGPLVGMFRATAVGPGRISDTAGSGETDYAMLAGIRSRGARLFVVGAAGIGRSRDDAVLNAPTYVVPAFDLSAHANYRVIGVALSLAGVLGPSPARYAALSFGVELGWFGWR